MYFKQGSETKRGDKNHENRSGSLQVIQNGRHIKYGPLELVVKDHLVSFFMGFGLFLS